MTTYIHEKDSPLTPAGSSRTAPVKRASALPEEKGLEDLESYGLLAAGVGTVAYGLFTRGLWGLFATGVGAGLTYHWLQRNELLGPGRTRKLLNTAATDTANVKGHVTVYRPPAEVYDRWRNFDFFSEYMPHLERIEPLTDSRHRWFARLPKTDEVVQWTTRILEDIEGERIVWESIPGSDIHNEGIVEFRNGSRDDITEIDVQIGYRVPAGEMGVKALDLLDALPEHFLEQNLLSFKEAIESSS